MLSEAWLTVEQIKEETIAINLDWVLSKWNGNNLSIVSNKDSEAVHMNAIVHMNTISLFQLRKTSIFSNLGQLPNVSQGRKLPKIQCTHFDVVNAFAQILLKQGAFTKVETDETPQNTASHQGMRYLLC